MVLWSSPAAVLRAVRSMSRLAVRLIIPGRRGRSLDLDTRLPVVPPDREEPMRSPVFHRVSVGGVTFDGIVAGDGPYLACQLNGGVALGIAGLLCLGQRAATRRSAGGSSNTTTKPASSSRPGFDRDAIRTLSPARRPRSSRSCLFTDPSCERRSGSV